MNAKTHETAVVVIPPEACWEPIQAIRRQHDRHLERWMPHITLVYPFRLRSEFDAVAPQLRMACAVVEPFEVCLAEFREFRHGRDSYTVWLAPQPPAALVRLQAALQSAVPDCDDTARYAAGFNPHLSVGQVRGRDFLTRLKSELAERWSPLTFTVNEVCLIWRSPPPDDVFRVDRAVPLGDL
ncbi:MAG TPA: 2'-5' RNA ligase family protein [Phycisphaerae bacterium]|nr:2'-5' RNA ligase family protein [Phycisphaerae bacterium]HNU45340.1 2'-5' RNA ligase family protein [Phycisphaerae bacterium]